MELLPKNIDVRGYLKALLSRSVGKKGRRLIKMRDSVRKKIGEHLLQQKYRMKTDEYYMKLGEFLGCGKRGVVEIDKDGSKRYRPYFCNLGKICFDCLNRYRKSMRWVNQDRVMAVAMANDVESIVFPVYTLHPEIVQAIPKGMNTKRADFLNEINRLAVDSFKQAIGLGSHRGREITGIISVMHPFRSRNPFVPALHFHLIWIPLRITKEGKLEKMSCFVDAKLARRIWHRAQVRFALKHGFRLAGSETNVFFEWVPIQYLSKFNFKMRYIFRSLLDDIFISVRYFTEDLQEFIWLEDMDSDWLPHLDKWELFESALEQYMSYPVKMSKSYGFLRNLKKHSKLLGIKQVEYKTDFKPVETIACRFRRINRRHFDKSLGKWIFKLSIQAKYGSFGWHDVPIKDVISETYAQTLRKKWIRGP